MTIDCIRPAFALLIILSTACAPADDAWHLPKGLKEVSGLALTADNQLLMMSDEKGIVYRYNPATRDITKLLASKVRDDFEGIAIADRDVYLISSKGLLYRAIDGAVAVGKSDVDYQVIDTHLSDTCEIEGLAFEQSHLLVLCKTVYVDAIKDNLVIFFVDPLTGDAEPGLSVPLSSLGRKKLNPSGIAVRDGQYYILASKQQRLLVLNRAGELRDEYKLKSHRQPEGIEIMPNGAIVIADEGGDGDGKLTFYSTISDISR